MEIEESQQIHRVVAGDREEVPFRGDCLDGGTLAAEGTERATQRPEGGILRFGGRRHDSRWCSGGEGEQTVGIS